MSDSILLTTRDVKRLEEERDAVLDQIATLQGTLAILDRKLDAARLFMPAGVPDGISGEVVGSGDRRFPKARKWAPTIVSLLRETGRGLTTAEFRQALVGTPLEGQVGIHGSALYNALAKMVRKRELIKERGLYRLPEQETVGTMGGVADDRSLEEAVLRLLDRHPEGVGPGVLLEALTSGSEAPAPPRDRRHFKRLLSRMLSKGRINEDGGLYTATRDARTDTP